MSGETLLGFVGILMIITIVWALIQSKTNPVPIFVVVPIIAAVIVGFGPQDIFGFIKNGVSKTWSTAVLFIFSIVYFSVMGDVGLFDPMVNWLAKKAGNNIMAVTIATSIIAIIAHLDGALASTLLITVPAMLPVYKKLHIRPVTLLVIIGAAMSIMNLVPWGGPVARVGVVLNADVNGLWQELIPLQGVGLIIVLAFAAYMGMVEKRRGAGLVPTGKAALLVEDMSESTNGATKEDFDAMKRPKLLWVNLLITLGVIGLLCFTKIPLYGSFMLGLAVALIINFRGAKAQEKAIKMHAGTALTMPMILLASGVFLGVLTGTGMMDSMASLLIGLVPTSIGGHLQTLLGILGVPIGMLLGTDSYFFGLVPLAISVGEKFGIDPHNMAIAMLISKNYGVLVTPHAATTFLACGLAGVELKDMLKFCAPRLFVLSLISLVCGALLGLFTI